MGGKKWKHLRSLFGQKDWLESMAEKWLTGSKHSQRLRKRRPIDRPTNRQLNCVHYLATDRQTDRVPSATTFGERRLFWASQPLSSSPYILKVHWDMFFCAVRLCGGGVEMLHLLAIFVDLLHLRSAIQSKSVSVYRKAFFALRKAFVLYFDHFAKYFHYSSLFPYLHTERKQSTRGTMGEICKKIYINMMFISLK